MAFDIIVIDIPALGERIQISRLMLHRMLAAGYIVFNIDAPGGQIAGTNFQDSRANGLMHTLTLDAPKTCDYAPIITEEEKRARMRRGWRPYRLPVVAPPVYARKVGAWFRCR